MSEQTLLTRMVLSFEIESDPVTIRCLRQSLDSDRGRIWFRHVLTEASEKLLNWTKGGSSWRVRVCGGRLSAPTDVDPEVTK